MTNKPRTVHKVPWVCISDDCTVPRPPIEHRAPCSRWSCIWDKERQKERKEKVWQPEEEEEMQEEKRPEGLGLGGGSQDRCSPQGEPALTCLPHKLFCSFRLHSKVVELGYKIISQATCLSSLAVQLANWREWFPVWVTVRDMAVQIWMILIPHLLSFSFNIWNILLVHRRKKKLLARGIEKNSDWQFFKLINKTSEERSLSVEFNCESVEVYFTVKKKKCWEEF